LQRILPGAFARTRRARRHVRTSPDRQPRQAVRPGGFDNWNRERAFRIAGSIVRDERDEIEDVHEAAEAEDTDEEKA